MMSPSGTTDDLDYMHARHYNLNLGRFLSPDPAPADPHNPSSWNVYTYVLNNPLKYTDPFGLSEADKMRNDCDDSAAGDQECESLVYRLMEANQWIRLRTVGNLPYLVTPPNFHLTTAVGGSTLSKFGLGLEGLSYFSLETTKMTEDQFSLEVQPDVLGFSLGFYQHGYELPRFTSFGLKGFVFDKGLWSRDLGWSFSNPGSVGTAMAWFGASIGWQAGLDDWLQHQFQDMFEAVQYVVGGP